MKIKLPESLVKAESAALTAIGIKPDSMNWQKFITVDLSFYSDKRLEVLRAILDAHTRMRGVKVALSDLDTWRKVKEDNDGAKPRTVEQFASFLTAILRRAPGHRVYYQSEARQAFLCYYVNEVEYHPPRRDSGGGVCPPFTDMELVWWEFGQRRVVHVQFHSEDCLHKPAIVALGAKGYVLETPELRAAYLAEVEKFNRLHDKVGLQLLASGVASADIDGNEWHRDYNRDSYRFSRASVAMEPEPGALSKVVVDVFQEEFARNSHGVDRVHLNTTFWRIRRKGAQWAAEDEDDDVVDEAYAGDEDDRKSYRDREGIPPEDALAPEEIEVPVHPNLAVFDLRRHLRLRLHVNCAEVYKYDEHLNDKLVIPESVRSLVDMLVAHRADFQDIVQGKGSGATILACGPPGVGKTLTAEVYAEATKRPLYSVQCSQLGIEPAALEQALLLTFHRAKRWNAILLLDEADVYIRARGNDLEQNAIVGVFLRVLEYYGGVLFMTTNRGDIVDDAIASRCIARIEYKVPTTDEQRRIWSILAEVGGVPLSESTINETVAMYPNLSGRDIKNLLKLVKMQMVALDRRPSHGSIEFAARFKPTRTVDPEEVH